MSYDGCGYALADGVAGGEGVLEAVYFLAQGGGAPEEVGTVGELDVFFGEVELELEQRCYVDKGVAECAQARGVASAHLCVGYAVFGA